MTVHGSKLLIGTSMAILLAACGSETHETHEADWGYEGEGAPAHWGSLSPDFATCDSGVEQSPIDIVNAVPIENAGI